MTARLVICTTCRFSSEEPVDAAGLSGGQVLLKAVKTAVEATSADALQVEAQACLWACRSHCVVYLAQSRKPAYVAGTFAPTNDVAKAIIDFARRYAASCDGAVPYRDWPEEMKGRFIARLPE